MKFSSLVLSSVLLFGIACTPTNSLQVAPGENDLVFPDLAQSWDEGMPLGNAFIGANVWENEGKLRIAIDRIDLWDLRPIDSLSGDNYRFKWVQEQLDKGTYYNVQKKFDEPYDRLPAPSKIPGAAIEFNTKPFGVISENRLIINEALLKITWDCGVEFNCFTHATKPVGWFMFEGVTKELIPELLAPKYQSSQAAEWQDPVTGQDLRRLEYIQGAVTHEGNTIRYHQKGYGNDYYDVVVQYQFSEGTLTGVWSITSSLSDKKSLAAVGKKLGAQEHVSQSMKDGIYKDYSTHANWWKNYWLSSSISLPNKLIEKQYYNEMYKFGCSSRQDSYIIPLQSVWTADNGLLPPWKGDVHHDLNTQLSYWPIYAGNICEVGMSFVNTLWDQRESNRSYTKQYFEVDGLNVPGVATLTGNPMGGWIQYAMSPTTSAWLAQHFYLHWRFTMDSLFLKERCYPYLSEVAKFLENITFLNENGERVLPISSSPEIYHNSPKAWFRTMTNYDLALIWNAFDMASKVATAVHVPEESIHWASLRDELPEFDLDENGALTFAKGFPYNESHRHLSNAMAIMPLSIFDVTTSEKGKQIVNNTISTIDRLGSNAWVGYSFSWLANMKARALDGEGAAEALETFASCFVLRNGFHVNGDQSGTGKSDFVYKPFTLEGNFAFAAGVQELLLQSHTGVIRLFPALPSSWREVSFKDLRAQGALLISAEKREGKVQNVLINPQVDGKFVLENPFTSSQFIIKGGEVLSTVGKLITIKGKAGEAIQLINQ
ncbi:MAG: glycosyl hydrolase family 95 catalytic domain-containing protein [Phocaeicola sp.]